MYKTSLRGLALGLALAVTGTAHGQTLSGRGIQTMDAVSGASIASKVQQLSQTVNVLGGVTVPQIQQSQNTLEQDVADLKNSVQSLESRVTTLETTLQGMSTQLTSINNQLTTLTNNNGQNGQNGQTGTSNLVLYSGNGRSQISCGPGERLISCTDDSGSSYCHVYPNYSANSCGGSYSGESGNCELHLVCEKQ